MRRRPPAKCRRHTLDVGHHTQHVAAREFGDIGIRPSSVHEFGEQCRVPVHAFEPHRCVFDAVEVGAQTDMVDARDRSDVFDVVGNLSQRRRTSET